MQRTRTSLTAVLLGVAITVVGCGETSTATGDITAAVKESRDLLGGGPNPNPNTAGEKPDGRREINWDGVPAMFTSNDALPGNFFNTTSPRGVLFTTDGSGFHVSNQGYTE